MNSTISRITDTLRICLIGVLAASTGSLQAFDETPPAAAQQATAPEKFRVKFETTKGDFLVEVNRSWAPNGTDRFHQLVTSGFYDQAGFFRVIPGFVVQFGLNADPAVQKKWTDSRIKDDPVVESNKRGYLTFAMAGPNTRTSQLFISYRDNARLDGLGFAPFGRVIEGMDVVDRINAEYGESPNQAAITARGNQYLKAEFPKLDYVTKATIVP